MAGTLEVLSTPRFTSGYVTVVRGWTQSVKRLTTEYEFSGAEPHNWETACSAYWYRGAARSSHGSDVGAVEPGEVMRCAFPAPVDFRLLTLSVEYVHGVLADAACRSPHLHPDMFRDDAVHAALRHACAAIADASVDDLERECAVRDVVLGVFARAGEAALPEHAARGARRAVTRAREFLHDNAFEQVQLDDVARAAACSKFHLTRTFHRAFGVPIHRYAQLIKVGRAIAIIRSGADLAEAAATVGFADQAHMTRMVRAMAGVTPLAFRPRSRSFSARSPRDVCARLS